MRGPESPKGKGVDRRPYRDLPDDGRGDEEEDDREEAKRWEMEEQQVRRASGFLSLSPLSLDRASVAAGVDWRARD